MMTARRLRSLWAVVGVTLVAGFAASLMGCATVGPVSTVMVPDIKSVTGTWKGILYVSSTEPDYVTLTIREDGTYDLVSQERIGTSRGSGKVVVSDGRLVFEGEKGHGAATLLKNPGGELVMYAQGTLDDNRTLTAKLWPSGSRGAAAVTK